MHLGCWDVPPDRPIGQREFVRIDFGGSARLGASVSYWIVGLAPQDVALDAAFKAGLAHLRRCVVKPRVVV